MHAPGQARRDVRLCVAAAGGELKGLLWISFLPRGWISVGFTDNAVLMPSLVSPSGPSEPAVLDLEMAHGRPSIVNPHFTLHAPGHCHLKSQNGTVLFEALVWTMPGPGQTVRPWLRFVSNPIPKLPRYTAVAHGRTAEVHELTSPDEEASVAIHMDFITEPQSTQPGEQKIAHYFTWGEVSFRVLAFCTPPQEAALGLEN